MPYRGALADIIFQLLGGLRAGMGYTGCGGMPIPATIRVVQIEPGPMPTFTTSAPAFSKSRVASAVTTLPATRGSEGTSLEEAAKILGKHRIEKLPIVDKRGILKGLRRLLFNRHILMNYAYAALTRHCYCKLAFGNGIHRQSSYNFYLMLPLNLLYFLQYYQDTFYSR